MELVQPLIKDDPDQPENLDEEDFQFEQNLVASLVHLFESENAEQLFAVYMTVRKHFGQGGAKRIKHTLPPLLFRSLRLAIRLKDNSNEVLLFFFLYTYILLYL